MSRLSLTVAAAAAAILASTSLPRPSPRAAWLQLLLLRRPLRRHPHLHPELLTRECWLGSAACAWTGPGRTLSSHAVRAPCLPPYRTPLHPLDLEKRVIVNSSHSSLHSPFIAALISLSSFCCSPPAFSQVTCARAHAASKTWNGKPGRRATQSRSALYAASPSCTAWRCFFDWPGE